VPREWWRYTLCSIALLMPSFWQEHIQAGDLSSHIYTAWLATRISAGAPLGLQIVPQTTNVLFDLLLTWLLRAFGADAAQHMAVAAAVLVFVWGAFAFARRIAGRQPWAMLPVIAMLAYGWVFRMGLFNFYVSLGLSFWALAVGWERTRRGLLPAVPLLAVAYTAHGLPVAWAVVVLAYPWLARAWRWMPVAAFAPIVALRGALQWTNMTRWMPTQFGAAVGANQFWLYGSKYRFVGWAVVALWAWGLALWIRSKGARAVVEDATVQIAALTAFGIVVLPSIIAISKSGHIFAYMGERMSLALGVCLCALAVRTGGWRWAPYAAAAIAVAFFALVWKDEGKLNALEDEMQAVVSQLPPGVRVISALMAEDMDTLPVTHMIDRVCVERCYSYANYEPSSLQFRVRVAGSSPVVVATDKEANELLVGTYVVQPRDVPLYQVVLRPGGRLAVRQVPAGQMTRIEIWSGL
jgi:hypothetical protein